MKMLEPMCGRIAMGQALRLQGVLVGRPGAAVLLQPEQDAAQAEQHALVAPLRQRRLQTLHRLRHQAGMLSNL